MVPGTGCGLCGHFNFYIYLLFFFLIHYLFQHLQRLLIPLCPHRGTGQQELRISLLKMMLLFFQKTPDRLHRADGDACLCRTPGNFRRCKRAVKLHENQKTGIAQMRSRFFSKNVPHRITQTLCLCRVQFLGLSDLAFQMSVPDKLAEGNLLCLGRRLVIKTPPLLIPFQQIRRHPAVSAKNASSSRYSFVLRSS